MENKYLIDASVLVEIIREKSGKNRCLEFLENLNGGLYISVLTLSIFWHYAESSSDFKLVSEFLDNFELLDITSIEVGLAYTFWQNNDFEDALQLACALENGCIKIITLDKNMAKKYQGLIEFEVV